MLFGFCVNMSLIKGKDGEKLLRVYLKRKKKVAFWFFQRVKYISSSKSTAVPVMCFCYGCSVMKIYLIFLVPRHSITTCLAEGIWFQGMNTDTTSPPTRR